MILLGVTEVANYCEISRQLAHKWTLRPDFPRPVATLAQGRVWREAEIVAWAAAQSPARARGSAGGSPPSAVG